MIGPTPTKRVFLLLNSNICTCHLQVTFTDVKISQNEKKIEGSKLFTAIKPLRGEGHLEVDSLTQEAKGTGDSPRLFAENLKVIDH
jgi:hypothetical protein